MSAPKVLPRYLFARLDGKTPQKKRQEYMDQFTRGNIDVPSCRSRVCLQGLNLQRRTSSSSRSCFGYQPNCGKPRIERTASNRAPHVDTELLQEWTGERRNQSLAPSRSGFSTSATPPPSCRPPRTTSSGRSHRRSAAGEPAQRCYASIVRVLQCGSRRSTGLCGAC